MNSVGPNSQPYAIQSKHDKTIGTPLTLIQGPLNDCIAQIEDKKVKETMKMASRNVVRLSRLVDSLMDFSKIAANRLEGTTLRTFNYDRNN